MKNNPTNRRSSRKPFENDRYESRFKSNFNKKEHSEHRERRSDREGRSEEFRSKRSEGFRKDRSEGFRKDRNEGFRKDRNEGFRKDRNEGFRSNRNEGFRSDRPMRRPKPEKKVLVQEFSSLVRLNKFIANSGVCSRREADELIAAGVVTVNGQVVTELGVKVNPDQDDIRFNGERLRGEEKVYVLMNKPKGYVTTTSDPHADACVMDLISPDLCPQRIFPVGRLDKSTTGVLLLTNDGALAEKLTHPSYQRKKIYHVFLDKNLKRPDFESLLTGFDLEDGFIAADALSYIDEHEDEVGMEIHSGRNRIVRRMFEHLGYTVKKLDRVYFAGMTKKNLKRGQWRFLTDSEVVLLKNGQYE